MRTIPAVHRDNPAFDRRCASHQVLQHYVQSVKKNERRQTILNTISRILGESLELDSILSRAIHLVSELAEVDAALAGGVHHPFILRVKGDGL